MEKEKILTILERNISEKILVQPDMKIEPEEAIISSGLIDSFSLVDLALQVEELFNIRIEDYELNSDTFDNLTELADLIIQKMAE